MLQEMRWEVVGEDDREVEEPIRIILLRHVLQLIDVQALEEIQT